MSSAEIKAKHAKLKKPPASARRGRTRPSASKLVKAKDPLFPRKQIRQIAHKMRVVGAAARLQGMIYAGTKQEIETKAQGVHPQVALKCEAVADNLDEAGDKLSTFPRFPESQWKSIEYPARFSECALGPQRPHRLAFNEPDKAARPIIMRNIEERAGRPPCPI
jgi:hypothetical protein